MLSLKGRLGLALASLVSLALVGCGGSGGSSSSRTASLKVTMAWPAPTRMVPNAANSVVATVTVKGKEVARSLFVRGGVRTMPDGGSTTLVLQSLPAGEAQVTFKAYPTTDGTGIAQASGTATETLVKGQITEETVAMASTVHTLSISPTTLSVAQGENADALEVEARDASNNVVLLDTEYREKLEWSSTNEATATVDEDGVVTGVLAGTTNVTVSMVVNDAEGTVTASAPVTVTAPLRVLQSITLTPATNFTITPVDVQFTATAHYSDSTTEDVTNTVTWNAATPTSGTATISASGLFHWTTTVSAIASTTVTATLNGVTSPPASVIYDYI